MSEYNPNGFTFTGEAKRETPTPDEEVLTESSPLSGFSQLELRDLMSGPFNNGWVTGPDHPAFSYLSQEALAQMREYVAPPTKNTVETIARRRELSQSIAAALEVAINKYFDEAA